MSNDTSLLRKGLAGLAALVVAAASLAVLAQPAQSIAEREHVEGEKCYDGCELGEELCCANVIS